MLDVYEPTPVHEVADAHDTPIRSLPSGVLGPGTDWTVQADPFHDSATVPSWSLLPGVSPTASQELEVVHETAFMEVLTVPARLSVVHEVPFHCAASESSFPPPTTLQKAADTQDTEPMKVSPVGAGAVDQEVPSQVSENLLQEVPLVVWQDGEDPRPGAEPAEHRCLAQACAFGQPVNGQAARPLPDDLSRAP